MNVKYFAAIIFFSLVSSVQAADNNSTTGAPVVPAPTVTPQPPAAPADPAQKPDALAPSNQQQPPQHKQKPTCGCCLTILGKLCCGKK